MEEFSEHLTMEVAITIRRQSDRQSDRYWQTYQLDIDPDSTTILHALHKIQWEQDGSLVFRRNCRNVICGSCGMKFHGKAGLACQRSVGSLLRNGELIIEPMGNFAVIKDLIVDMSTFWQDLQRVQPALTAHPKQVSQKEGLQTPQQRDQLQASANCILCGACYSACEVKEVNPQFVGPHALAKAYRVLADNRDCQTTDRLSLYNADGFVWGCTRCYQCNEACPVGVAPLERITQIKQIILSQSQLPETIPLKHRRTLLDLVKKEGWIDESKFALRVIGIKKLIPLGLRMFRSGKMPMPWQFKPSQGQKQIKALLVALEQKKH